MPIVPPLQSLKRRTRHSPRWLIGNTGVILAIILFLGTALPLGLIALRMLNIERGAEDAVEVMRESGQLGQAINAMNASGRVYLNLRDPALLQERQRTKDSIAGRFAHLREHMEGYPEKIGALDEAQRRNEAQVKLFDEMIAAAGPVGTARVEGEAERLANTRAINTLFSGIRDWAAERFLSAQQRLAADMRLCMILGLTGAIGAPLSGIFGIYLLRHERTTQRSRELQRELMHMQRLAIMGSTSEMLAHEMTQALTAAAQYQVALRRRLAAGSFDNTGEWADNIGLQYQRAGAVVKRLRRFIDKREAGLSPEAPSVLVNDAIALMGTREPNLALYTEVPSDLPEIMVDRVQLQQVFVNLILHGMETMARHPQPRLEITAQAKDKDKTVEFAVADNGPGLPRGRKPFEPGAEGEGIGLSICRDIIQAHRGTLRAEANPGGGTIFRFALPVYVERAA